jgi:hypothetical protein
VSSTATTRSSANAGPTRTARLRAGQRRAALLRAARARRVRLERAARARLRILRAAQTSRPTPLTTTPVVDPTTLFFIDPAQPFVQYQTPEAVAAGMDPIAAALLPISTAAAAALLPGVSASASSSLHATSAPELVLSPSGGFDGSARFEGFLLGQFAPVQPIALSNLPAVSRAPVLTDATGGRELASVAGGGRGIGVNTPLGRIGVEHGDYVFGNTRYAVASVSGVLTTAFLALAALALIAALLAAIAAVGKFLEAGVRRGGERTRDELYAAARRMQIPGRSHMSNAELRRALDEQRGSRGPM